MQKNRLSLTTAPHDSIQLENSLIESFRNIQIENQSQNASLDIINQENFDQSHQNDRKSIKNDKSKEAASLSRNNDVVYTATTNVVKAIMSLSQGVEKACAIEYLNLVKNVGMQLRTLLSSVDTLASIFPPQAHK